MFIVGGKADVLSAQYLWRANIDTVSSAFTPTLFHSCAIAPTPTTLISLASTA